MIAQGQEAPDFDCDASTGRIRLRSLRGSPVILYFYPAADTPGCTVESKAFRDLMPRFTEKRIRVVGISTDTVAAQQKFAQHCSLPFPLVADVTKEITRNYGVLGLAGTAKRVTFMIDALGTVVEVVEGPALKHPEAAERRFLSG